MTSNSFHSIHNFRSETEPRRREKEAAGRGLHEHPTFSMDWRFAKLIFCVILYLYLSQLVLAMETSKY